MQSVDLLALENQVCFALAVASRRVIALYRPLLEPMGLTHPQYLVMLALWGKEPMTVRELGERLSLEPATLSPLLKRLEAAAMGLRIRLTADSTGTSESGSTPRLVASAKRTANWRSCLSRRARAAANSSAHAVAMSGAVDPTHTSAAAQSTWASSRA